MHVDVASPVDYYCSQSSITDLGPYGHLLTCLPADVPDLCRIVQGLLIHYCEGGMYGIDIPPNRRQEIDTRHVAGMLARIQELDGRPLAMVRQPERRLLGCCRDFSTLLCALLRHQGRAARVRFGYSTYFRPDFNCDHVLCEYWNGERWLLVDPQMDDMHRRANEIDFDVYDVPRRRFIPAGEAWRLCRSGRADPARFGVSEDLCGMWFVQGYLVRDVAALNKMELLCWDSWGLADIAPGTVAVEDDLVVLDSLASLTLEGNAALSTLQAIYERHPGLRVGAKVTSYSPAGIHQAVLAGTPGEPSP